MKKMNWSPHFWAFQSLIPMPYPILPSPPSSPSLPHLPALSTLDPSASHDLHNLKPFNLCIPSASFAAVPSPGQLVPGTSNFTSINGKPLLILMFHNLLTHPLGTTVPIFHFSYIPASRLHPSQYLASSFAKTKVVPLRIFLYVLSPSLFSSSLSSFLSILSPRKICLFSAPYLTFNSINYSLSLISPSLPLLWVLFPPQPTRIFSSPPSFKETLPWPCLPFKLSSSLLPSLLSQTSWKRCLPSLSLHPYLPLSPQSTALCPLSLSPDIALLKTANGFLVSHQIEWSLPIFISYPATCPFLLAIVSSLGFGGN